MHVRLRWGQHIVFKKPSLSGYPARPAAPSNRLCNTCGTVYRNDFQNII